VSMDGHSRSPHTPSTAIVPRAAAGVDAPAQLLAAADVALGAGALATRMALRLAELGWGAGTVVGRTVGGLPGAGGALRIADGLLTPLRREGSELRAHTLSAADAGSQRLLQALVPRVVDALDVDALLRRVDVDELTRRIDVDALVARIDIDALVQRIEIDALVSRIDIDALVSRIEIDDVVRRIDVDALVARIDIDALVRRIEIDEVVRRIDVNEVVQRVDVDAIVEETELGTIVARSTSGFATAALDAARTQTAGVDRRLSRAVNRVMRRREEDLPAGPPLLVGEPEAGDEPGSAGVSRPGGEGAGEDDRGAGGLHRPVEHEEHRRP
jgi:hypothetical protein